jgi:ADP-ribose pyrophosphatase
MELELLHREILYQGKVVDLFVDQIRYPSGNSGVREIAHHPGGAVAVPILDDGRVLLVRQLRYPVGRHLLELPAGKLNPGEDPRDAAARELSEETGYLAEKLEKLTAVYSTPGFCDEILHLYLARGLRASAAGTRREEGELSMTLEFIPLPEALEMAAGGKIEDAKTVVGLLLADRKLRRG